MYRGINIFLLFVLCIIYTQTLTAQQYQFEHIISEEGDANLSVRDIIQDENGIIWLATSNGLYKYQGDEFITKNKIHSSKELNKPLTALSQDKNHNIWIGSSSGLTKYNLANTEIKTYTKDTIPGSLTSTQIRSLEVDKEGRLWIGTSNEGLILFQPEKGVFSKISFEKLNVSTPDYVKTIFIDSFGKIWLGSLNDGIYCFTYSSGTVNSVKNYRTDNFGELSNDNIYGFFEDPNGVLAVCTQDGLNIKAPGSETFEDISSKYFPLGYSTNYFREIMRDKNGKLWILTWGGLILTDSFSSLESGSYTLLKHSRNNPSSISHDQMLSILEDKSGIIWIGTESGLNQYSPYKNQFLPFHGEIVDKMSKQSITDYAFYEDGILMLSLSDGILYLHDGKIEKFCEELLLAEKLRNDKMFSLLVASDNSIWIGTYNGQLIKIDKNCQTISIFKNASENNPINKLIELDGQNILVGSERNGLLYFNRQKLKFSFDEVLGGDYSIRDLYIDKNKKLWVATHNGVFFRNTSSKGYNFYIPNAQSEMPFVNSFNSIAESDDNKIFVGGRSGLYEYIPTESEFEKKEFNNITEIWITDMLFDSRNELWLNLNFNKVAKWDMQNDVLELFDVNNGVRSITHNHRGFFIDDEDILHVSGFEGFYAFDISKPIENEYSPHPVFTGLFINNTKVKPGKEINGQIVLKKNLNYQDQLVLNHKNKEFSISFTSTSYLNQKRNEYKYKLHGYNQDWIIGNDNSITFENIRPGKYTFEVFSANNDGYWSQVSSKLAIRIKPSPFLSIWAILGYLVVIIAITFQSIKMVKARILLRRQLLVEKVKREKEEKFHKERLKFYTNISHELRTPLTLIIGPIKQIMANEIKTDKNAGLNKLILNNSQRMLTLVNQLLDFRKSLHQGMKLKTSYSDPVEIVESNIQSFNYIAREKSISVIFNKDINIPKGWIDKEKLDIILFNILSNAFKYTPNGGFITVNLRTSKNELYGCCIEMSVLNTGKGIPKHLQEKVFERFYQVDDNSGSVNNGSGIGLAFVKNLVELHRGKITLESEPGKTTQFSVIIPIEKNAYTEDEIFDFAVDADRRTLELHHQSNTNISNNKDSSNSKNASKILIVEDNNELRNFIIEFLSDEFQMVEADNATKGLELCVGEMPDLVVSDVMMEGLNGWTLCKKLKSDPEISHIPVILMTALASQENKKTGYKVGADDFITKPFEPELLKIRIRNILENRAKIKENYLKNKITSVKELTISRPDEEFMDKMIGILEKNLDNPDFDVDSFCKEMSVSASKLYLKIKGISGLSPVEFITTYRLKKAAQLIKESDLSISEIAYKLGFNDPRYFSKRFKKQFGTTPSEFSSAS